MSCFLITHPIMTVQKVCPKKLVAPWRTDIFQKVLLLVSKYSGNKKIWNWCFFLPFQIFSFYYVWTLIFLYYLLSVQAWRGSYLEMYLAGCLRPSCRSYHRSFMGTKVYPETISNLNKKAY